LVRNVQHNVQFKINASRTRTFRGIIHKSKARRDEYIANVKRTKFTPEDLTVGATHLLPVMRCKVELFPPDAGPTTQCRGISHKKWIRRIHGRGRHWYLMTGSTARQCHDQSRVTNRRGNDLYVMGCALAAQIHLFDLESKDAPIQRSRGAAKYPKQINRYTDKIFCFWEPNICFGDKDKTSISRSYFR